MTRRTWYWYFCRDNELLLDLDSKFRLQLAMKKLSSADRQLQIMNVWVYRSVSDEKYHAAVRLAHDTLTARQRILWAWWAGSDPMRAMYNLTRIEQGVPFPDLLIAPTRWQTYWRAPDKTCVCDHKHKGENLCRLCPVFRQIHAAHAGKAYYPLAEQFSLREGLQSWPLEK